MRRREFLRSTVIAGSGLALSKAMPLFGDTSEPAWRKFEVTTRVEVLKPRGQTTIWLPAALIREAPFQRTLANRFTAEGGYR
jgi:hypothetical protein